MVLLSDRPTMAEPLRRPAGTRQHGLDAAAAAALALVALLLRLDRPVTDGLFYDDAWMALGVSEGSFWDLRTVGQSQPGFTFVLMIWKTVFGSGTTSLTAPAFIAGVLGAPALYVVLRRLGHARAVAFFVASLVVASTAHITYSHRVKTYTSDVILVLVLALAVPWFARRRWTLVTASFWLGVSLAVASFSSFMLLAASAAGVIVVLHHRGDWRLRAGTVAVQAVGEVLLFKAVSTTHDSEGVAAFFHGRDGYIDFDPNPLRLAPEVLERFLNVMEAFPGGPGWVAPVALVVVAFGLGNAAWRGESSVTARLFLVMVTIALGGAIVDRVPFGPNKASVRVVLWLIPVVALGIAEALRFARARVERAGHRRAWFDGLVLGAAGAVLFSSLPPAEDPYPYAGAKSATRSVMAELGPTDAVWITRYTTYSFALYSDTPVSLEGTPERLIGFLPEFADARLHLFDLEVDEDELDVALRGVDRVFVIAATIARSYDRNVRNLLISLVFRDFEVTSWEPIGSARVGVMERRQE